MPFYESWGIIHNRKGRVIDPDSSEPIVGEYTAGWIKRGPSGVIGTNKPDALETVRNMLADVTDGIHLNPAFPSVDAAQQMVNERQPDFFSYADWLRLDEIEVAKGEALGRPRVKFTTVEEMQTALGR